MWLYFPPHGFTSAPANSYAQAAALNRACDMQAVAIVHRTAVLHANEAAKVSPLPVPLSTFNVRGLVQTFRWVYSPCT